MFLLSYYDFLLRVSVIHHPLVDFCCLFNCWLYSGRAFFYHSLSRACFSLLADREFKRDVAVGEPFRAVVSLRWNVSSMRTPPTPGTESTECPTVRTMSFCSSMRESAGWMVGRGISSKSRPMLWLMP